MRFELGLDEPDPRRARNSALTIALSYVAGGLIPLTPYFLLSSVGAALWWSVGVTLGAAAVFGYVKGRFRRPTRSAAPGRRRWSGPRRRGRLHHRKVPWLNRGSD